MKVDVDAAAAVESRRARVCAALRDTGVDVLVVGRPANLAFLSGARRVLVRGSRPFAPLALLLPATGELSIQSATEGVAPHVFAQSWNPRNVARDLAGVPALANATRVGVDAMTPGWATLLHDLAPGATVVAVDHVLRGVRMVPTSGERPMLQRAIDVALAGYAAVLGALGPGVSERELRASFASTVAGLGVTTLPHEAIISVVRDGGSVGRLPHDMAVRDGDRVVVDAGVVVDGYEAGVARTIRCGEHEVGGPPGWSALRDAVADACRPGATGAALDTAARHAGARDERVPLAHGYGFGPEPPFAPGDTLADGTVLAVQARMHDGFARDMVVVSPGGGTVLTEAAGTAPAPRHATMTSP